MDFSQTYDLDKILVAPNAATLLSDADRSRIGSDVMDGYESDKTSRSRWEQDMAEAMKLTLQVTEEKTEPWVGASNVKFPLVTIAALQFHARVMPMLIPGPEIAKCRVIGKHTQEKIDRAYRIACHMSWQLLEQDVAWEEWHDKCEFVVAIMGNAYKKSYFNTSEKYVTSELVSPADLVVNYWTRTTVDDAPRATHVRHFSCNKVTEYVRRGYYLKDDDASPTLVEADPLDQARKDREGTTEPALDDTTPTILYEQLCWYDLDGDGYKEPYIATVEKDGCLRRLVARFVDRDIERDQKKQIVHIKPLPMYTKYALIPAPDGGFYDLGFGRLLGPINESINTAFNQLFDAGTLSNYGGGFLGRGARFRGGQYTFKPQEWKQVDAPGDDLRKNIVPLPVREPSQVLMKLVEFLVGYGQQIASSNDLQMGENIGQNTPAETARTMNQNGQRVLASMYKRQWRAFRDELRVRYKLNQVYLPADVDFENLVTGEGAILFADDYLGPSTDVRPVADPVMVDDVTQLNNADFVMGMAYKLPNFNKYLTTRRVLELRRVPDIDQIYPAPQPPQGAPPGTVGDVPSPPDPKMLELELKKGKLALEQQEFQQAQMEWKAEMMLDVQEDQRTLQLVQAQIYKLQADATKALAEAKGVETGHMVGILQTQMAGVENQIRMLELHANAMQDRVKMKLGKMKILEAAVKTTGTVHGVATKIEDRRSKQREEGVVTPPADEIISAGTERLVAGDMPVMG